MISTSLIPSTIRRTTAVTCSQALLSLAVVTVLAHALPAYDDTKPAQTDSVKSDSTQVKAEGSDQKAEQTPEADRPVAEDSNSAKQAESDKGGTKKDPQKPQPQPQGATPDEPKQKQTTKKPDPRKKSDKANKPKQEPKKPKKPEKPPVPPPPAWQSAGLKLLRPDRLTGWDYGPKPIKGWSNTAGTLIGKQDSTPLLSGFTLGDFRLRLQWSIKAKGAFLLELPAVEGDGSLKIAFNEGEGGGRLSDGEEVLRAGGKIAPAPDKPHAAELARSHNKLTLTIDGEQLWQVDVEPKRRFGLQLAVERGEASIGDLRLSEPPGQPIFNAKDLTGWWTPGNLNAWKAESGQLVLHGPGGNYIRTDKEYGNYTLSFQFIARKGANSGVGIRTPRDGWPSAEGMELQIWDAPPSVGVNKSVTMAVYGNMPPLARSDRSQRWNDVVIKADGPMITAWVNDELVQHLNTAQHPELRHRHAQGWIGFQDHGAWIHLHNLRILQAPAGNGLAAWHEAPAFNGSMTLADRLMNHQRLSANERIKSAVAKKHVAADEPGEHLLAELKGPGAVVRVVRDNDQGRLAFFFDGEEKPRLECKPADLAHAGPVFDENRQVTLTCLPYKKSLKIVLRDAKAANYRIDYAMFPPSIPVATFTSPKANFPRGWLSAMDYRRGQHSWGVLRFAGPAPQKHSPKLTLAPGESQSLLAFDGAGILQWFRLSTHPKQLANNDLWLEITVDGEAEPAIAAPARYWFPGLVGKGNWHNYVTLKRNGLVSRLAMPFGKGISFALKNTGEKPIPGVQLSASVLRPAEPYRADPAGRMRLRGQFLEAGDAENLLAGREGKGRLIGLVYRQADEMVPGLTQLAVDGQEQPGWSAKNLDGFLGAPGDFRSALSGRDGKLTWRWMLLAPVGFQKSIRLESDKQVLGDRFALFYIEK